MEAIYWAALFGMIALVMVLASAMRTASSSSVVAANNMDPRRIGVHVESIDFGDDDVLLLQCQEGYSTEQWKAMRESFDAVLAARLQPGIDGETRRRAVIFPPGFNLNVLHLKRNSAYLDGSAAAKGEAVRQ